MKKSYLLIILLLSLLFLSCRNSKELIYLKDATHQKNFSGLPVKNVEHTLKTGDILFISIKSMNPEVNALFNPETNMESGSFNSFQKYTTPEGAYLYGFEIDMNGYIKLPMMGKIKVAGVQQSDAEALIQQMADGVLKDAMVKVKLLNFKITVLGEVRTPGIYYNYNNSMTILDAVAMANGNTDFATIKKVMVVRSGQNGNTPYMLDLSSKKIFASEAFYLQPNDYVFVRPDKYKNFQLNSQAYSLLVSSLSMLLAILAFALR